MSATQFTKVRALARKHRVTWPSKKAFEQAAQFVRAGTDRHVAAALMLGGKPTMEQIEAITGRAHYNVVAALKEAGCKAASGTDKNGLKLYGFTLPKRKA